MNQKSLSLILGLITIFCWGSLATFGNLLLHLPPFYILGVTFLIGSIPAFFRVREMFPDWKILLWGVFGYFGYHFFLFYSFRFAPAVEANLINYLWPVIMVLATPLAFPGEKLKAYHWFGAFLSVVGCLVLVLGKGVALQASNLGGYGLALLAAFTWPLYSIGKKKMGKTSVWAVGGFCFVAGILCLGTHALIEPRVVLQTKDAGLLLLMGVGPFGIAFYCWDLALSKGDARVIGALAYLTPVLSTLGLVFFAGQVLETSTLTGMILIITGASAGLLDFFPSKS
ncbi:MAG: DMT family transporter [Bacteriovoracia bacterium]